MNSKRTDDPPIFRIPLVVWPVTRARSLQFDAALLATSRAARAVSRFQLNGKQLFFKAADAICMARAIRVILL